MRRSRVCIDPELMAAAHRKKNRPYCTRCGQEPPHRGSEDTETAGEWLHRWGHRDQTGEPCGGTVVLRNGVFA